MVGTGGPIGQGGIFSDDLGTMLDPNQPIYRLSKKIPWSILIEALSKQYAAGGRPSLPLRRMIGLTILKHLYDLMIFPRFGGPPDKQHQLLLKGIHP